MSRSQVGAIMCSVISFVLDQSESRECSWCFKGAGHLSLEGIRDGGQHCQAFHREEKERMEKGHLVQRSIVFIIDRIKIANSRPVVSYIYFSLLLHLFFSHQLCENKGSRLLIQTVSCAKSAGLVPETQKKYIYIFFPFLFFLPKISIQFWCVFLLLRCAWQSMRLNLMVFRWHLSSMPRRTCSHRPNRLPCGKSSANGAFFSFACWQ